VIQRFVLGCVILKLALPTGVASAQDGASRVEAGSTSRRLISASDIAAWKRIHSAALSRDGQWFGYILAPNEGDSELVLRATRSEAMRRFPVGEGGGRFAFSADTRWLLYLRAPSREAARQLRRAGRPVWSTLVILELATGRTAELEDIRGFTLDGRRSRTAVLEPEREPGPVPAGGNALARAMERDLVLYDLAAGTQRRLASVQEFAFDPSGRWLAWTVEADSQPANGLHLCDLETGVDRVLDQDRALYGGLRWADSSSDHLAVLKGRVDTARGDTLYALLWYTGLSTGAPRSARFDPHADPAVPAGFTIGPARPVRWAEDQEAIFFGIRPLRERPAADSTPPEEQVKLVLWHWKEPRVQSQRQVEKAADDAFTYLAVYHLRERRFVRLADDRLREVDVAPRSRWALGWDVSAYATNNWLTGRHHADLYAVDVRTGVRRLLRRRFLLQFGLPGRVRRYFFSPDGVHVLTWAAGAYTVHDLATGASRPLLRKDGPAFGRQPYDYSPHKAPLEPVAWSTDGAVVILSDGWDLWAVPLAGEARVNLTVDGRRKGLHYAEVASALMGADPIGGSDSPLVDLSAPWYVWTRAQWGKASGYARINGRTPGAHRVLWDEASLDWPMKAPEADVIVFRRGTAVEYPDYYVTDLSFTTPRRLTEANPQQRELLWPSGTMVVDYRGPHGERLQAALLLPANYRQGKRYPAVTLIYERESFHRNYYAAPGEWGGGGGEGTGVDAMLYAGRGYVIIYPDIDYVRDRPGTSALHCVLGAVRAAVAAGVVDSTRVGLAGHSWGGYESAFIATQTSFFKAVLAAAGITNIISAYGGIHPTSGAMLSAQTESDQLRLTRPYWRDVQSYIRESPVFHVDKVTAPILLVHNDGDDAVDWRQGLEFYNGMRRAKKPIVLLQYVGQGHSTGGAAGRDLGRRAREFFDHFLMAAPTPAWWTEGVPYREMDEHLRQREAPE